MQFFVILDSVIIKKSNKKLTLGVILLRPAKRGGEGSL